jgi:hypothetical protein
MKQVDHHGRGTSPVSCQITQSVTITISMYIHFAVVILAITPPLTGIAILVWDSSPPRIRSTIAFGSTFLLAAMVLALLGMGSAVIDGRQPFIPYLLITGLPALTVARAMQIELNTQ